MNRPDVYLSRREQLFPKLSQAQIERIKPYGDVVNHEQGDILFDVAAEHTDFYVVLSGRIAIVQVGLEGESEITVHEPYEFSGEVDMLSAQRSVVRAEVREGGEFLRLDREQFHRLLAEDAELSELMMRAFIVRRVALITHNQGNIILVGSGTQGRTLEIEQFLSRSGQPHRFLDSDKDEGAANLLEAFSVARDELPVVVLAHIGKVLRNPTPRLIADVTGLSGDLAEDAHYDVAIVGAGPAGLSASVYAASEGLRTVTFEARAFGGQAGSSSKIENYLGFPTGISGGGLTGRALNQAQKFGAQLLLPRAVRALDCSAQPYELELDDGARLRADTIIVSSGARYRRLPLEDTDRFEGAGMYYGATYVEARTCVEEDVVVVGGGNSAGQAAVFLAGHARHVHVLVRGSSLADSMSAYLTQRLERADDITIHYHTEIVGLHGEAHLESMTWSQHGETREMPIRHVFVMIGATPNTEWLDGCLLTDSKGFILTGDALPEDARRPDARAPYHLESSKRGIFAVGDVRADSVKRVASAVGEGAMAIQWVHRVLAEIARDD